MTITLIFFNLSIVLQFFTPVPYGGHSTFVGPIYQPTNPADWAHRADLGSDFYAR
jgi:hypothetical protein